MSYPALITVAMVKSHLRIEQADQAVDGVIDTLIAEVSDEIQARLGYPLKTVEGHVLPVVTGNGSDRITLMGPVAAVTAVESADTSVGSTFSALTGTELRTDGVLTYVYYPGGFSSARQYKITVTAGYEDVPGDIQRVAREMVMARLKDSKLNGVGEDRFGKSAIAKSDRGVATTETMKSMQAEWDAVIGRYLYITV